MAFNEKIRQLRKDSNLSQEQLAEKLAVSRQAISKWELGESTPDTDKIIQLSKIFNVSTDYLLLDEVKSDSKIPTDKMNDELLKQQYRIKTIFIFATGVSIIGLIISIVALLTWQTVFSISVGVILQIIGIIIFEAMVIRYHSEDEIRQVHRRFYALNIWFLLPFPVSFITNLMLSFYPRPRAYAIDLLCAVILYLVLCGTTVFFLIKKPNNRR